MRGQRLYIRNTLKGLIAASTMLLAPDPAMADEYPYSYRSAYFLGRGDTGIAIAEDDDAIFYNPAGIAIGKGIYKKIVLANPMVEISENTRDVARQLVLEEKEVADTLRRQLGKSQHVGFNNFTGVILRRAAIGAYASNSTTAMVYKDPIQGAFESVYARARADVGMTFSLASHLFSREHLFIGVTGKIIQRTQAAIDANAAEADQVAELSSDEIAMTGQGFAGDLGMMYRGGGRSDPSFGITIQDIGDTKFEPSVETTLSPQERPLKPQKQTVNIGVAVSPGTKFSKFRVLADLRDVLNANDESIYKRIHLGTEITTLGVLGFTAGMNQGYGSFGIYGDMRVLRIDVGVYTEEVGETVGERPDTRFFLRIGAGL